MKDRIPGKPGRYKFTFEDGTIQYATIERADEPIEEGTPLNRDTLLSPRVQSLLGLSDEGTPSEALEAIIPYVQDTGWLPLWENNDPSTDSRINALVYSNDAGYYPAYRKIGNVVYLHGVVKPASNMTAGINTEIVVGYLPKGFYNPSKHMLSVQQTSGAGRCLLTVNSTGKVYLNRYGYGTTYQAFTTSTWLPIDASFVIN